MPVAALLVHKFLCMGRSTGIQSVYSGQVSHLLTCHSAGVMLAPYAAEPTKYCQKHSSSFKDVTYKVGEIKRNLKQYIETKHHFLQRAVIDRALEFVLIGRLLVPRGKSDDNILDSEIADAVSIFVHQL